jgi:hypothetical protein
MARTTRAAAKALEEHQSDEDGASPLQTIETAPKAPIDELHHDEVTENATIDAPKKSKGKKKGAKSKKGKKNKAHEQTTEITNAADEEAPAGSLEEKVSDELSGEEIQSALSGNQGKSWIPILVALGFRVNKLH